MGLQQTIYNTIFKRTSTMALACVISAFFFERSFDLGSDLVFEKINEGKLWKQIKDKYQ
ncbi:cytochrome b-c1 complex subunit 9 [Anoplophora glabripennis]|uniref:cytochrome b-c1 complex subunit 9 n=1 Tax=Anoplophora glabripennis TaxID=217634 RepID=UPI0008753B3B|nr:cytochrome b-c1 complex subunit 9 [Anoplophora glabripennis]